MSSLHMALVSIILTVAHNSLNDYQYQPVWEFPKTRGSNIDLKIGEVLAVARMEKRPFTILYCTILYYTVLYCTILYSTLLYSTLLYSTLLYSQLNSTLPYSTLLYSTILYYTILYYTILYYTIPCFNILYSIM